MALEINGMPRAEARELEIPPRDGFAFNLRKNCIAIGRAIAMREIFQLVLFYLLRGLIWPSFDEFGYFF